MGGRGARKKVLTPGQLETPRVSPPSGVGRHSDGAAAQPNFSQTSRVTVPSLSFLNDKVRRLVRESFPRSLGRVLEE